MLGFDVVGDFRKYHGQIRKYNALLKLLERETRDKVANGNCVHIMPKKGITLPHGYVYPETRYTHYDGPLPSEDDPRYNRSPSKAAMVAPGVRP